MRIGIDVSFLKDQYSYRGIGNYGRELIKRILKNSEHEFVLFGFEDQASNYQELEIKSDSNISFVSLGKARKSNPLNPFFFRFSFLPKIVKAKLDLYFAPYFERGLPIGKVKTAVMVHDVIPFVTGSYSQKGKITNFFKGLFYKQNLEIAKKADLILTNSDFTERELINKAGFSHEKIVRTYLGIKDSFREEAITQDTRDIRRVLMMYKIPKPYILYYGGLESNKNVNSLFYAFKNVTKRFPDMKLVISDKAFKQGWDNKVQALTKRAEELMKLSEDIKIKHNVVFAGYMEDQHMPIIMKNAEIFVHLSTYEGFGFAPLEAMAAGVPVVAARRSCYPEILGEGAELVNPKEPDLIADAILGLLEDENKVSRLVTLGLETANKYSWDNCATETMASFEKVLAEIPKLKICYISTYFYPKTGGAEQNCLNLARQMVLNGHSVTVLTSDAGDKSLARKESYEGISIKRFHKYNNAYYFGFYPGLIFELLKSRFDIIHAHGFGFIWHDLGLILKKIFSTKSVRFINTPHGPFMAQRHYSFLKQIAKTLFTNIQKLYLNSLYNQVIAVNPNQEGWISKYGITKSKIVYLANGINEENFEPVDAKETADTLKLNKKFIISFLGRYEKYKGLQDLIAITPKLTEHQKSVKVIAMGNSGAYLADLNKQLTAKDLEASVTLLVDPDDKTLHSVLQESKIFVMPSEWEAFGISMLEAMARGNAIISTRTEGGEFLIKENENGFLYDYGDRSELANFIIKLLDDRKLLATISQNNIQKAKGFLWKKIGKDYQKYLIELLKI